mmetsp:Transcript_28711/g.46434  ORF Transcript_28711/g.46434 Transcript_28711/m.46434 type:complete len:255 (-) Transcript_28711:1968-2732(-)
MEFGSESELRAANDRMQDEIEELRKQVPLIGPRENGFRSLSSELEKSQMFTKKMPSVEKKYGGIRRVRGDGNCFFRGFMFRYLEILIENEAERKRVTELVRGSLDYLLLVGYEKVSIETFYDVVLDMLEGLGGETDIQKLFSDDGESDYVVWYCRLLCAGFLKHNEDRFMPFITGLYSNIADFCSKEVEPMGKDCEQVQVIAVCDYLGVNVCVEYLDSSDSEQTSSHMFGPEKQTGPVIHLLYRPSHYDILYSK